MECLAGLANGVISNLFKPAFEEIKHLTSLRDDAERLRQQIDRVKGIVDDINNKLNRQCRKPLQVVRNWLETQEQTIKSAKDVFGQYEVSKNHKLCWCCPDCFFVVRSSQNIRDSLAAIDVLLKRKESDFPVNGELGEPPNPLVQPLESELVGKYVHEKLAELEKWLLEDESVRVVGVYGMPGVGKTALLKQINKNEKVLDLFKLVIWVTVSRDSDVAVVQRSICERIELAWRPNLSIDEAAGVLHSVFKERRLLLILDDVWKTIEVSKLGISLSDNKIKVLLTSRDRNVCKSMKANRVIEMKHLQEEEGWQLFCREAFVAEEVQHMDREIESFAIEVAKECKGHPLALKTLARAMPVLLDSTASEWEHILKQLKEIDPHFYRVREDILRELFNPLKHSYDALQTDEIKQCFLYLAAYREDEEIDADQLIQLWLAEGLVKSREDGRYNCLKILQERCLVEIVVKEENGLDIWKVRIHDVLRDMAVRVAEVDQNTLFRAGQSLTEFPKNVNAATVRLSLMHNRIRPLPETLDCEKLLSLLLSWNTIERVPEGFLEKLNMLKVLDLSNTLIKSLPKSIQQLKNLLYLQLSNTQIKVIPDRIYELSSLQLLDLSFSLLKSIPSMINKLKRLQILKLAHCNDLEFVSCNISKLTSLEELDMWQSAKEFAYSQEERGGGELREASLQDVCKLHRLKRLRVSVKSAIGKGTVGNLVELEELWMLWKPGVGQTNLPNDMRAMDKLERLHLYDCQIQVNSYLFPEIQNLKFIKLKSCQMLLTLSGLGLGRLPQLKEIEIEECLPLKELGEEFGKKGCFPKLRKLQLRTLSSVESICSYFEEGALPMLETLALFRCKNVKVLPGGLDNLKSLRQIRGDKEWWNEMRWENEETKDHLHAKFDEILEARDNNH